MADQSRPSYPPPPQDYSYPQHPQHSPARQDDRSAYPAPPDPRGQYSAPPDPRPQYAPQPPPAGYGPPPTWSGQPQANYGPPPVHHQYDQTHGHAYHYPAPPHQGQPPYDPNRPNIPPMNPYPYAYPPQQYQQPPPAPAPRQRTAIACKYCRKRKIRCSGYENALDGRCQNCVRFNQTCHFHPVSSQGAFVPVQAVMRNAGGDAQNTPMIVYGPHGQPLGPMVPGGPLPQGYGAQTSPPPPPQHQGYPPQYQAPQYSYPPQGYGPPPPQAPPSHIPPPIATGAPPSYDHQAPPPTASSDQSDRISLKRGPPDDDNEPPTARPRIGYETHQTSTSPANSSLSYSYNGHATNSAQHTNGTSPPTTTSRSGSPKDAKPEDQPGSSNSSQNGRSGMRVHDILGGAHPQYNENSRAKNDTDMLSKLNGRK